MEMLKQVILGMMYIKINKGISVYTNTNYPLLKTTFITSLGHTRVIPNSHHWYKIREGLHTLPAKNPTDYDDIRGTWCSIEIESEIVENKEVKFFSLQTVKKWSKSQDQNEPCTLLTNVAVNVVSPESLPCPATFTAVVVECVGVPF